MAYDYLYLSTVPIEEPCLQVGKASYSQMCKEARAYIEALEAEYPFEDATKLCITIKREDHDYGAYPAVVVRYDPDDEEACKLAYEIEVNEPSTWEELGIERPYPEWDDMRGS